MKDANTDLILNYDKYTDLQVNYNFNMVAIVIIPLVKWGLYRFSLATLHTVEYHCRSLALIRKRQATAPTS